MNAASDDTATYIRQQFQDRGEIRVVDIEIKAYPDETNYIVFVDESDFAAAASIGNDLDAVISTPARRCYVVVRKAPEALIESTAGPMPDGIQDQRAVRLTQLISARSRVSEAQPSLSYVRDASAHLSAIETKRHHLIFGRRGAGKTALLVEARRQLVNSGNLPVWLNMQTLRHEPTERVFLHVAEELVSVLAAQQQVIKAHSTVAVAAVDLFDEIRGMLSLRAPDRSDVMRLLPRIQRTLKRFGEISGKTLFVFVDDFYYFPRSQQPLLLDMLHGCVRDCDAWLKVASIRHLTRWFQSSPPLGLQTGHDADLLDLDVTLQTPARAKGFLESILKQYAKHVGVSSLARIFHPEALDRLVLASGAVPRDYLVLAGNAITKARARANAKQVGVQDVNVAAGDAAQVKLQELEEDMAAEVETATRAIRALNTIRRFCLEETSYTYFLVSFKEKEAMPELYDVLTDVLDQRLIHLLDGAVSDPHAAGHRYEAFMLDLSQYSGSRLKHGIHVLDFSAGKIVARRTGVSTGERTGDTSRQLIAILRAAPTLKLKSFADGDGGSAGASG